MKFSVALIALVASTTYALPQGQSQWSDLSSIPAAPQGSPAPAAHNENQGNQVVDAEQPAATPEIPQGSGNPPSGQQQDGPKTTFVPAPSPAVPDRNEAQNNPAPSDDRNTPKPSPGSGPGSNSIPDNGAGSGTGSTSGSGQSPWTRWRRDNPKEDESNSQPNQRQQQGQLPPSPSPATPQNPSPSAKASPSPNKAFQNSAVPSPDPTFQSPAASVVSKLGSDPSNTCTWEFILTCANQAVAAGTTCLAPLAEASTNCFTQSGCAASIGNNAPTCATCFNSVGKQQFVKASYEGKTDSNVAPIFEAFVSSGVCDAQGNDIHA